MSRLPPVKTPTKKPADGGIMRFFTVTPKKATDTSQSDAPTPSSHVKLESFQSTPSKPVVDGSLKSTSSIANHSPSSNHTPKKSLYQSARFSPTKMSDETGTTSVKSEPTHENDSKSAPKLLSTPISSKLAASPAPKALLSTPALTETLTSKPPTSTRPSKWNLQFDSDDDDDGPALKTKGKAPAKRKLVDSDASASEASDSDSGSDSGGFVESEDEAPKPKRAVAHKTSSSSTPRGKSPSSKVTNSPARPSKPATNDNDNDEDDGDGEGDGDGANPPSIKDLASSLPKWVLPEHRLDANRRPPSHPDFDDRTLYIPPAEFAKFTPAMKQFWEIKSQNFDVVLFFKMGKFYELFDVDAEIGVRELGLIRMGSGRLHAGFPEIAFTKQAEKLVALGYKVGRVEQTQTPKQLAEANKTAKKGEKASVVRREMCTILTKSTLTDSDVVGGDHSSYLLSIFEIPITPIDSNSKTFVDKRATATEAGIMYRAESSSGLDMIIGVCFVDAASGSIHVGRLYDDRQRTKLRTLFVQARPCEVLYPKNGLSPATEAVLRSCLPPGACRSPQPQKEFGTAASALALLEKANYFSPDNVNRKCADEFVGPDGWPLVFSHFRDIYRCAKADQGDSEDTIRNGSALSEENTLESVQDELSLLCGANQEVIRSARQTGVEAVLTALGGCVTYLRRLIVDMDTIPLGNVRVYSPLTQLEASHLVLDSQSLVNLEILENQEGGKEGSLLAHLDHCATPFGKRMLRSWVARPLGRVADINSRLDAIEDILANYDSISRVTSQLRKLPDLERLLARVRANGSKVDTAIMYENVGKQRVELFLKTLKGFAMAIDVMQTLCSVEWKSTILSTLLNVDGVLSDVTTLVREFEGAFDHAQAARDGHIVPQKGIVVEYDASVVEVQKHERAMDAYLAEQQDKFKDKNICYFHRMREVYQLEIPSSTVKRVKVPLSYEQTSQTKTVQRYYTDELKALIADLETAKDKKDELLQDVTRRVFHKFGLDFPLWSRAVSILAEVDCLISLAMVSRYAASGATCRPVFLSQEEAKGKAVLELRGSVHPSMSSSSITAAYEGAPTNFIPNDILMGCEDNSSQFVLVSGPNMGGKSTLLRQVCCAVIMAQIGCYVASESCVMTPCDRIFTRVGANDRIMQGQSTFLVELEETSSILRHATQKSLVILDELGRGTSTFDGTSIAYAVIDHLVQKTKCLTLFSTHYHMLLEEFKTNPLVSMYHMACEARTRNTTMSDGEPTETDDKVDVTFLYKFIPGVCSKSFGMNVATLAGLPRHIVMRAKAMSELFEEKLQLAHKLVPVDKKALYQSIQEALKNKDLQALQHLQKQVLEVM